MTQRFFALLLLCLPACVLAQSTFKVGWNTYQAATITRQFTYRYTYTDSTVLTLIDTMTILSTADSLVHLTMHTPMREKAMYKTACFLNIKKQMVKLEEYKNDNLLSNKEWKYDDKNRRSSQIEENKVTGNFYRKTYDYSADKKSGDMVVTESSYYNNKIEFYTKSYFDRSNTKYKEVRLNDNNKDVIHIESYTYGDNGKVRERSVYFPEFKVTKKFSEHDGDVPAKCFKTLPVGIADKPNLNARIPYIKKVLVKNQAIIYDKDCDEFEYRFFNGSNCEIIVSTTKTTNVWQVVYRYKDRAQ